MHWYMSYKIHNLLLGGYGHKLQCTYSAQVIDN